MQRRGVPWAAVQPGQLGILLSSAMAGSVSEITLHALSFLHLGKELCAPATAAEEETETPGVSHSHVGRRRKPRA